MTIEAAFFGTLGGNAERKVSKTEKPYLRLNVRVGDGDGATWVSVMAFDSNAVDNAPKFEKGSTVYVEGSLRPTQWTGQDGAQRHGLSVLAWHCRLAQIGRNRPRRERRPPADARRFSAPRSAAAVGADPAFDDEIPF